MKPPVSWWWAALVGLVAIGTLPVIGHWVRADDRPRCHFDGLVIDSAFRVRIEVESGSGTEFCDVSCARSWLAGHRSASSRILVTDEESGDLMESTDAFFVRSSIITNSITGNRWHVFRTRDRALQHARESRGRLMSESDHPFATHGNAP